MSHDIEPDGPLTPEQEALVRALSAEFTGKIDATLLSQVSVQWRKVAMVVGMAMMPWKIAAWASRIFTTRNA